MAACNAACVLACDCVCMRACVWLRLLGFVACLLLCVCLCGLNCLATADAATSTKWAAAGLRGPDAFERFSKLHYIFKPAALLKKPAHFSSTDNSTRVGKTP